MVLVPVPLGNTHTLFYVRGLPEAGCPPPTLWATGGRRGPPAPSTAAHDTDKPGPPRKGAAHETCRAVLTMKNYSSRIVRSVETHNPNLSFIGRLCADLSVAGQENSSASYSWRMTDVLPTYGDALLTVSAAGLHL
eukprot:jgi/Botrbrau1/22957/Bobra.0030s0029.1